MNIIETVEFRRRKIEFAKGKLKRQNLKGKFEKGKYYWCRAQIK